MGEDAAVKVCGCGQGGCESGGVVGFFHARLHGSGSTQEADEALGEHGHECSLPGPSGILALRRQQKA